MKTLLSRRELLATMVLAAGGGCLCRASDSHGLSTCCHTPMLEPGSYTVHEQRLRIELTKAPSLKPTSSAAYVTEGGLQLIIVRSGRKRYHALSRLCTHGQQVLSYVQERRRLMCNSFNHSQFYLDGSIAKGPAESAIKCFPCNLKGGILEVAL